VVRTPVPKTGRRESVRVRLLRLPRFRTLHRDEPTRAPACKAGPSKALAPVALERATLSRVQRSRAHTHGGIGQRRCAGFETRNNNAPLTRTRSFFPRPTEAAQHARDVAGSTPAAGATRA